MLYEYGTGFRGNAVFYIVHRSVTTAFTYSGSLALSNNQFESLPGGIVKFLNEKVYHGLVTIREYLFISEQQRIRD